MCVPLHKTPFKIKLSITFNTVVPSAVLTRPTTTQIGLYRIRGYHIHVAEDSSLLGCYAVSTRKSLPYFWSVAVPA